MEKKRNSFSLKVLSSEMDLAESTAGSFDRSSLKSEARRYFRKIGQCPIL
jgi:hypothetical protein